MGMREAWRKPLGEPVVEQGMRQRAFALDLLAGMRVMIVETDLDLETSSPVPELDGLQRSFGDTETWVDPLIGARATLDLTDRVFLLARGDVGGFHLGSDLSSETWLNLGVDFRLLGHDAFADLGSWRESEALLRLAHFAVMTRPPLHGALADWLPKCARDDFELAPDGLSARHRDAPSWIRRIEVTALDISSSGIRERLRAGRSIRYLVPEAVREAIEASGVYGPPPGGKLPGTG
jgi:hypothetical protein